MCRMVLFLLFRAGNAPVRCNKKGKKGAKYVKSANFVGENKNIDHEKT